MKIKETEIDFLITKLKELKKYNGTLKKIRLAIEQTYNNGNKPIANYKGVEIYPHDVNHILHMRHSNVSNLINGTEEVIMEVMSEIVEMV